jgi:outer membrane lipoprotein-sorting protein
VRDRPGIVRRAAPLALALTLSGCSMFPSTRKLPVPIAPDRIETVTPEQLVAELNQHWDTLESLTAKVTITASIENPKQGVVRVEPTIPGIILWRKPDMLRVYGQVPILGTRMFDMASDGHRFTLYIPSQQRAIEGPNSLSRKSPNQFENMRPGFFFDAVVVKGVDAADRYSVTDDSETVVDPAKKHLLLKPEYVLDVVKPKSGSQENTATRKVIFDRTTLLPYEQDVYDSQGNIETRVIYEGYRDFGTINYPSTITILRPLESYKFVLSVQSVNENLPLKDDTFTVQIPRDTKVENLD